MKKLSPRGLKYLKILHLISAIMWIGGAISMVAILYLILPTTPDGYYIRSLSVKLIDDLLVIPGAIGILITGIIYGIWSNWGFFKHMWIIVKWVITIVLVIFGTFVLGEWINGNVYNQEAIGNYISNHEIFVHNVGQSIFWGSIQTVCLFVVVWISVIKPWKKKRERD